LHPFLFSFCLFTRCDQRTIYQFWLWLDFLRRKRRFVKIDQWKHTIIDRKHKETRERECNGRKNRFSGFFMMTYTWYNFWKWNNVLLTSLNLCSFEICEKMLQHIDIKLRLENLKLKHEIKSKLSKRNPMLAQSRS